MTFRERLVFDADRGEYRDGDIRYMMIRPDALMGIFAELPDRRRAEALVAFARSIRRFGGRSARAYQDAGAPGPATLLRTIEETAPQLGWGQWRLVRTADGLMLTVANSPFAAGASHEAGAVCHPITGMMVAVGEMVLGCEVAVTETACAHDGAACCRFSVTPAARPPAAAAALDR